MAKVEDIEVGTAVVNVRADTSEFERAMRDLRTVRVPLPIHVARWTECVMLAAILWRVW